MTHDKTKKKCEPYLEALDHGTAMDLFHEDV